MNEPTITCPNCGNEFPLDAAFREHFERERQEAVTAALTNERQAAQERQQAREQYLRQELAQEQQQSQADLVAELREVKDGRMLHRSGSINRRWSEYV